MLLVVKRLFYGFAQIINGKECSILSEKKLTFAKNSNNLIFKTMKKILLLALMVLTIGLAVHAQELKKEEI